MASIMAMRRSPEYFRGDIEGLRAVAALAIVVFHASSGSLPGGFVGVDLFFVISGYLITASIQREMEAGTFSLSTFYARRIRRLYPALLVTILLTMAASFFFLFPRELRHLSRSAIATVLYVSNFYFASRSDYFSEEQVQPLLHTWSLGVEEQFYLLYPLFLLAVARGAARKPVVPLAALLAASLALAELMVRVHPTTAFFASPTRFWELAAGGLVALLPPLAWSRLSREIMAIAGGAMAGAALLFFSDAVPVPGMATLLPVLGIAMLIKSGEAPTMTARLLAIPPLRYVGRISYSLYLVHWPFIVLLQANNLTMPARYATVLSILGSIVLAWLLHILVEAPARRIPISGHRRRIFVAAGGATAGVVATASLVLLAGGFRERVPDRSRQMIAFLDYDARPIYRAGRCLMNAEAEREGADFDAATCIGPMSAASPRVLLIGDSHAAQYYEAMHDNFPGIQLAQVTATGCRPLLHPTGSEHCAALMNQAFRLLKRKGAFDTIILAGRWQAEDLRDITQTAAFMGRHASRVYVMGPIIEYRIPLPRLLAFSYLDGRLDELDGDESVDVARQWRRTRLIDERMARLMRPLSPRVRYLSVYKAMCKGDDCETLTPSGTPMQFDYGHLTYEGSMQLIRGLKMRGDFAGLTSGPVGS